MKSDTNRLVLGTAQLGFAYGIANTAGQPNQPLATEIVGAALDGGIIEFDTAQGYGDSEKVLGASFEELGCANYVEVVSKVGTELLSNSVVLADSINCSLERLKINSLQSLLLHQEDSLRMWDKGLRETVYSCLNQGLIRSVGISVYDPEIALRALGTDGIDLVQIPSNLFDRRFERAGVFDFAQKLGKKLYVRSAFLQGVVFMKSVNLPEKLFRFGGVLDALDGLCERWDLSRLELALGYAKAAYVEAKILFGAETVHQVESNLNAWETELPVGCVEEIRTTFSDLSDQFLNPSKWS